MSATVGMRHGKMVNQLIICAFIGSVLCVSCGCGATEKDSDAMLTAWVTGALALISEENDTKNNTEVSEKSTTEQEMEETEVTEESGGNPEELHSRTVEITVFEDCYFFQNHEISYEELISVFDELGEEDVVIIYDDNATRNAYQKILSEMEKRGVLYINGS